MNQRRSIDEKEEMAEKIAEIQKRELVNKLFPSNKFGTYRSDEDLWFISKRYAMSVNNFSNKNEISYDIYSLRQINHFNITQDGGSDLVFTFWTGSQIKKTLVATSKADITKLNTLIANYFIPNLQE